MPELPEVETVRRGLAPVLEGRRLARVEARRPDLRFPLPANFVQLLTGATITRLERRAKYMLARLDREDTLVMHLGMSGRFEIARPDGTVRPGEFHYAPDPDPKHAHIVFETEDGGRVTYYDPRRFGYMDLINTATLELHPWFAGLGPEPLSDDFDAARLKQAFKGRKQGPKTLLLDQRIVAGLGNIYVCEALNRARISPFKPAGGVSKARLTGLTQDIREVLNAICYVLSTGCRWQALPKDRPSKSTAHYHFMPWEWDGTLVRIHHALYVATREQTGRDASPSAAIARAKLSLRAVRPSGTTLRGII